MPSILYLSILVHVAVSIYTENRVYILSIVLQLWVTHAYPNKFITGAPRGSVSLVATLAVDLLDTDPEKPPLLFPLHHTTINGAD